MLEKKVKTVGFPISHKENENRRAIVPAHLKKIEHPELLYFEKEYGAVLGFEDSEYEACGSHIASHRDVLSKEIICDPKIGDADYLSELDHQTIFGWIHATQNRDITDKLLQNGLTAFAWEKCFKKDVTFFGATMSLQVRRQSCMRFSVLQECLMKQRSQLSVEETRHVVLLRFLTC